MKKRLVCLVLVIALVLSFNTVVLASPGGGVHGDPVMAVIDSASPDACQNQDNGQCQDSDNDQDYD